MRIGVACLLLSSSSLAFQLPFKLPFFKSDSVTQEVLEAEVPTITQPRIAIIGAGAGGSSAAYWISKAKERYGFDVQVDVFDKSDYIGGRSTTVYPFNNKTLAPIELGASIFVKVNKNLWRASEEFDLERVDFTREEAQMGIWDGEQFLLTTGSRFGDWWDTLKVLWRYGYTGPTRTQKIVNEIVAQFVTLYTRGSPKWANMSNLATSFGWSDIIAQSTAGYLDSQGISPKFTREMVEAATRVNYGQDADKIHALEGACSMATSGATSVKGGNWRIFEQFLKRSQANVFLNTTVLSLTQNPDSNRWTVKTNDGTMHYSGVILAAPFHQTGIDVPSSISEQVPEQPYVHLHVTLLSTTAATPDPRYFGLSAGSHIPSMVLTTYEGVRNGGKEPEFNSLSYHGFITKDVPDTPDQYSVKIFSKERVSDEWLDKIFMGQVGWVYRKEWDAYPHLPPTTTFPPVKLANGFYYVNAFEPFISTMETETIASRNVVDLLLTETFGTGICGAASPVEGEQQAQESPDFVLGWDC
ncbi:hypothetical protein HWV62_38711 [Athelia sp. TMB]|nr:hypothetical protein HWV62_38711 [Athelia sp. TMB]